MVTTVANHVMLIVMNTKRVPRWEMLMEMYVCIGLYKLFMLP